MKRRLPFDQLTPEMQSLLLTLSLLTTIDRKAFSAWHLTHCKDLAFRFRRSGEPEDEYGAWLRLEFLAERELHKASRRTSAFHRSGPPPDATGPDRKSAGDFDSCVRALQRKARR